MLINGYWCKQSRPRWGVTEWDILSGSATFGLQRGRYVFFQTITCEPTIPGFIACSFMEEMEDSIGRKKVYIFKKRTSSICILLIVGVVRLIILFHHHRSLICLTHFILDNGKQVLQQMVKTRMKCLKRLYFIQVCSVYVDLKSSETGTSFYRNFDQRPLVVRNGQFHFGCINVYGMIYQNEKG